MVDKSSRVSFPCTNMWRKIFRRIFIFSQLALAMYYSNNAITSWNDSPIVTSVKMTSIQNVQFPAVTICYDTNEWKWPGIVHAMSKLDKNAAAVDFYLDDGNFFGEFHSRIRATYIQFRKSHAFKTADEMQNTKGFIQQILPKELQPIGILLHFIHFFEPWSKLSSFMYNLVINAFLLKLQNKMDLNERSVTLVDLTCSNFANNPALKYCSELGPTTLDINCSLDQLNANVTSFLSQWCTDCNDDDQECLKSPDNFRKEVTILRMIEDYVTKQNAIEFYTVFNVKQNGHKILQLDETIKWNNLSMIETWVQMNGGAEAVKQRYQDNTAQDTVFRRMESQESFSASNGNLKVLADLFSKPDIHGNNQQDFVLVPLCSFGSKDMKSCHSFKPSYFDITGPKKCFTFNGNFSDHLKGEQLGPNLGLNFLLNYAIPFEQGLEQKIDIDLILHESGTTPDIHGRTNTFIKIKPGKHYIIDTDATLTDVTESFKMMDLDKRGCKVNEDNKYHEINCYFQQLIDYSIHQCQCVPWYMNNQNYSAQVCTSNGFTCFELTINDKAIQEKMWDNCYPACTYTQYSLKVNKIEEFKPERMEYPEVKADVRGSLPNIMTWDGKPYFTLVKINFGSPRATVITQDAKVTFADMVGSIGGTFGVFLGISFVSLVDELVEWCVWLKRRF